MSQFFDLCLANETLANDARQLGVAIEDLQRIQVRVSAALIQQPEMSLQLRYCITLPTETLADKLHWPTWQAEQVLFSDYLWQETCLECFITGQFISDNADYNLDNTAPYIEINANPDGRYALYQFDSYRNPETLPPPPLLLADKQTRASIDWVKKPTSQTASANYHYERSFTVSLQQLCLTNDIQDSKQVSNTKLIKRLHPCVILCLDKTTLYFANQHASPPDFHDQHYWCKCVL